MINIQISESLFAIVDDRDAHLAEYRWGAMFTKHGKVYARRVESGKTILLHRQVLGLTEGDPLVDHLDGDGLNCTRENLVKSDYVLNARNRPGAQRNNLSSGHLGVNIHKKTGEWEVRIRVRGRRIWIGRFKKLDDAVDARLKAEKKYWGVVPQRVSAHRS